MPKTHIEAKHESQGSVMTIAEAFDRKLLTQGSIVETFYGSDRATLVMLHGNYLRPIWIINGFGRVLKDDTKIRIL